MEMHIILHLDGLNLICHLSCQRSSSNKSAWSLLQSTLLEMIPYKSASSAKSLTEDCKFAGKSFTYNKNNNGPRTVPRGTPDVTLMDFDWLPSQITD